MNTEDFRKHAHELVDWTANYLESVEQYPVKSQVAPGDILNQLPSSAPQTGESFQKIFADFEKIIMPGMTHWQHPSFFAYFPANSSPPALLGEMLTSALGAQCMSWQTSPAATELEERVMTWVGKMLGLPSNFTGVIQDTASTSTLCAILSAREAASDFTTNAQGLQAASKFVVYSSTEVHSSIDRAVKIAGIGAANLRKIAVDENYAMQPDQLQLQIESDKAQGLVPLCVVAALGTTSSTAVDPLAAIGEICVRNKIWLHVDAAYAGSALVLPEMRWMTEGIEHADSFVFNPHKWMFTNFDCSAYFVRDAATLVRTFEILPEYLKTAEGERVKNFRDWGVQLGRRFRALKLWFVLRSYGVEGIQAVIRSHIMLAHEFAGWVKASPDFELLAPVPVGLVCFRYHPKQILDSKVVDSLNERLLEKLNKSGKIYLTHTKLGGAYTLRMSIGQTNVSHPHIQHAWQLINESVRDLS